ncbi:hypothetical protein SAMN05216361_3081 [Marisediminitalea aggregata]|uniref:Uncharacterized protein n=1 Tax=Marisediminitalea aggregata TaxID=634436 RepID=A0A1M5N578_9ALTE|nr:hypothetical protein [Marisediminitalea aggregata]SHG84708.1 hypothetical protein SAMN05216361_3081 [Marisediminitalea aggregata]
MSKFTSFSRHLDKDWLDQTLYWVAKGVDNSTLNQSIENMLTNTVKTPENRRKARNLLVSIWGPDKNPGSRDFDETALSLYRKTEQSELVLQWGKLVARKPFFADIARFIGRYSRLNPSFQYAQVKKRMCELYGDTESTARSTRAVLKTMQELGALLKDEAGVITIAPSILINDADTINWLLKGVLEADEQTSRALDEALHDPIWFPFQFGFNANHIDSKWFELHQQGNNLYLFLKQDVQ